MITCTAALVATTDTMDSGFVDGLWPVADEYTEQPRAANARPGGTTMPQTLVDYALVEQLVSGDFDEVEPLMGELQQDLREGDARLARLLLELARNASLDPDTRSLALETVAGARVRRFENELREAIRSVLESHVPRLQFSGIAAASDLSPLNRLAIAGVVREIASAPGAHASVKGAAEAFLRRRV